MDVMSIDQDFTKKKKEQKMDELYWGFKEDKLRLEYPFACSEIYMKPVPITFSGMIKTALQE